LCEQFEQLSGKRKRNFWSLVGRQSGEQFSNNQAVSHYIQSYKMALYNPLTAAHKEWLNKLLIQSVVMNEQANVQNVTQSAMQ